MRERQSTRTGRTDINAPCFIESQRVGNSGMARIGVVYIGESVSVRVHDLEADPLETRRKLLSLWLAPPNAFASVADQSEDREGRMMGEYRYRYLGVLLAAVLVALGVLAYLYYERTKPVAKIDLPGVSGEITKEGVDIEVGKPKN